MIFDDSDEVFAFKRFGQVVHSAHHEALELGFQFTAGSCQENHRNGGGFCVFFQDATNFESDSFLAWLNPGE